MPEVIGTSLPSLPITSFDVSEVTDFTAEFVYNFYTPDELINQNSSATRFSNPSQYSDRIPRFVKLRWNKVNVSSDVKPKQEVIAISIEDNYQSIVDEESLYLKYYYDFQQQEISFTTQTQLYFDRLYRQLGYNNINASLTDATKALHESTPEQLSEKFINKYLNYSHSNNVFVEGKMENPAKSNEKISTVVPALNKVFATLLHEKIVNDSLTPITPTISNGLTTTFAIQNSVRQYSNRFNGSQYDLFIESSIKTEAKEFQTDPGLVFQTIGYIIERFRIQGDELVEKKVFFIENPDTIELFDTEVLYGQKYTYNIKVITAVQKLTFDLIEKVDILSTFLFSSKFVRALVDCVDLRPSEPPTDFYIRWDAGMKKLVLTWNFPIDSRRHIKYFQVFRRKNMGAMRPIQLPFELIRMFDFNDLQQSKGFIYQISNGAFSFLNGEENIDASLVVSQNTLKQTVVFTPTCFIDEEFSKEDYYIYAIAAVDAHGITTNYSNQLGIKFNKQKNNIDVVDISAPNAPKPYPNLYINKDTFIDTFKNENYSQMSIVFDPDFFELKKPTGENLNLINFGENNFYRLQLINTDLQTDQFIDINVIDDRKIK